MTNLSTKFDYDKVMHLNYGNADAAILAMQKTLSICFKCRSNRVARLRAKSCVDVIKQIRRAKRD